MSALYSPWLSVIAVVLPAVVILHEAEAQWDALPIRAPTSLRRSVWNLWTVRNFPSPLDSPKECGRKNASYLCNPHQVLTEDEASQVDVWLQNLCHETHCACDHCPPHCPGTRLSILLVQQLPVLHQQSSNTSSVSNQQSTLTHWASHLRRRVWGFATCHDDVLLIISAQDDFQMYFSVGETVTRVFTELCAEQIYYWIKPSLAEGNFLRALDLLIKDIRDVSLGHHGCRHILYFLSTGQKIAIIYGAICLPVMACVVFIFLGPCFRGRGFGGARHKMMFQSYTRRAEMQDPRKSLI